MKRTITDSSGVSVTVKQHGAELCGLKGACGREYMWQGDPAVWGRHAPILFPIVGKLADDRYTWEGQSYVMKQHGFARDSDFQLVEAAASSLTYRLESSTVTRQQYPFDFALIRRYGLVSGVLEVHTTVANSGAKVMPFSIGEHPGFSLAWGAGDQVEDYSLEFEKAETLDTVLLDSNHLLGRETDRVMTNERILPLRRDLFDRDALIFVKLESRKISLCSRKHKNRLTVEFPGYPYLGIWAKPGAPFVCIEPWFGHADTSTHDGQLKHKAGIIRLNPGETFSCVWRVSVKEP